jgi:hypothetical protein
MPLRSLLTMASSDESTMAASRAVASSVVIEPEGEGMYVPLSYTDHTRRSSALD